MGSFGPAIAAAIVVLSLLHHQIDAIIERNGKKGCNIFQGKWVYDESYPLYNPTDCPFIEKPFTCQNNGRPDKIYTKYKFQPSSCNLPRFNGKDFLKKSTGKKIMFVGDSLSLNQWQSLTCMLHKAVPLVKYDLVSIRGLSIFRFPAYNVSIMFWRNGLLVDVVNEKIGRVLKLDSLENGDSWKTVDILIFHSWHWWHFTGSQQRWDFFQEGNITYKDMDRLVAYRKGLSTWARWVDSNIDPIKTQVFFQGVSPDHDNASDWADPNAKNCIGQQKPVLQRTYPGGRNLAQVVVEKVLRKMSTTVYLLNVTTLSQFRKDGHPSIYGYGGRRGTDCIHWCLPGVPDAWNDLLYKALFYNA